MLLLLLKTIFPGMARSRSRSRGRADDDVAGEVRPFRKGKKKGVGSPRSKKIPTLTYKVVSCCCKITF